MLASWVADVLGGEWKGAVAPDLSFEGVGIDSRCIKRGYVFIALPSARKDGHAFVADALMRGASGCLVSTKPASGHGPYLLVNDTHQALCDLAKAWRARFNTVRLIGITGSCGKTTSKDWLGHVLGQIAPTLTAERSYNNHLGVPLTLLRLRAHHQFAVLELGANHPFEIEKLAKLARPSLGMITNIEPVHLEGFGSLSAIAKSKGALFDALPADGIVVYNSDASFMDTWRTQIGARTRYTFGLAPHAMVRATHIVSHPDRIDCKLHLPNGTSETIHLPVPGRHQVYNALGVAACAHALGVSIAVIKAGLERVSASVQRMVITTISPSIRLIDDSYNASPAAVKAAVSVLKGACQAARTRSIVVLGDMGELGKEAIRWHRAIGDYLRNADITQLYTYGTLTCYTARAFGAGARHFEDQSHLIACLRDALGVGSEEGDVTVILVKGSRSMHMERVVTALQEGAM